MPETTSRPIQVVGLGQVCVDYVGLVGGYPVEDTKTELEGFYTSCGGPAATALVTLARAGIRTSFLGTISDDLFGLQIVETLKREDVDISRLKITPGCNSQFAFISVNRTNGDRTIFWRRAGTPELTPPEASLSPFPHARILHVDSLMVEVAKVAAMEARERGMTVVMDAGTLRAGTLDLVKQVDILISSASFSRSLTGPGAAHEATLQKLMAFGPRQAVITLGRRGAIGMDSADLIIRQPAFPVASRDTTGAGDVYHGAYIYGLLQGWNMAECMAFASAASALKCRNGGGWRGIPSVREIKSLMKTSTTQIR